MREPPVGKQVRLPGHFDVQVTLEAARPLGKGFEIRVRLPDGSLDYAKQDEVRERVWQQHWDLVIINEAHKGSAYTKRSSSRGDEAEKTKRSQLAEKLTAEADHVVLLTATPHHGDDDRFAHFVRLLDPDLFPEPHRLADKAGEIRRDILRLGPDCPWALRRLKEDLKDLDGCRLFPDRHAHTITFRLNRDEYDLYKAVTAYINDFLPQATGKKKQSVALARTVLQRRLASSTMAIFESIRRRLQKQQELLEELGNLPPAQRAKRLAQLQGRLTDAEQEEDDLDDAERDLVADEFTSAVELDQLRSEIAALQELLARARRVKDRSDRLAAVRRMGKPDPAYRKMTFHKDHLDLDQHVDAVQLGDSYWLYVVGNPLNNPDSMPLVIQNPAKHLDHAKNEVVAARYFDVPADAIEQAAAR